MCSASAAQVEVAGHRLGPGVGDPDRRPAERVVVEADALHVGARGGAVGAVEDRRRAGARERRLRLAVRAAHQGGSLVAGETLAPRPRPTSMAPAPSSIHRRAPPGSTARPARASRSASSTATTTASWLAGRPRRSRRAPPGRSSTRSPRRRLAHPRRHRAHADRGRRRRDPARARPRRPLASRRRRAPRPRRDPRRRSRVVVDDQRVPGAPARARGRRVRRTRAAWVRALDLAVEPLDQRLRATRRRAATSSASRTTRPRTASARSSSTTASGWLVDYPGIAVRAA